MNKRKKKLNGKLIYQRSTKPVRIDSGLHREAKIEAAKRGVMIRDIVEEGLAEVLAVDYE